MACIDQERVCGVTLTSNNTSCEVVLVCKENKVKSAENQGAV
jgi:hypothetical protein